MLDERKRRIGENEALFRRVNELVRPLERKWMTVLCECGDRACRDQIVIAQEQYVRVREDSALFILRPGHDVSATEEIQSKNLEFWIVRKDPGLPERVARATDPNRQLPA